MPFIYRRSLPLSFSLFSIYRVMSVLFTVCLLLFPKALKRRSCDLLNASKNYDMYTDMHNSDNTPADAAANILMTFDTDDRRPDTCIHFSVEYYIK